ncbi:unnamed protein product [Penicillium nalgiovense]|nr:unnamed protein product [Penicillium nalgiovense]
MDLVKKQYMILRFHQSTVEGEELKARYAIHQAMVADSSSLLESEAFSTRLRRCLEQLESLDTIGLAHYSTTFLLDPSQQKGRLLGWHRLIDQIDFRIGSQNLSTLHAKKTRKLSTCHDDYCGEVAPRNWPHRRAIQVRSSLSVVNEVEGQHICLAFNNKPTRRDMLAAPNWTDLFLKVAPRLERLALSQDQYSGELF